MVRANQARLADARNTKLALLEAAASADTLGRSRCSYEISTLTERDCRSRI